MNQYNSDIYILLGLEDELRVSRGHVERIKTLEDELKATNGRNDQLNVKCENAQKDMKVNNLTIWLHNHLINCVTKFLVDRRL